jgi:hypothetical protein
MLWTDAQFWKDATWRSFRTFCQTLAALLGGQTFTALSAPWQSMLSVAATASLISLFQSIDRGRALTTSGPEIVLESAAPVPPAAQVVPLGVDHAVVSSCGDTR